MTVRERIAALRELMAEKGIDIYYIPNEDDHLSDEYTADYFQCKTFMSGFTGDYGCVIVTPDFAGLWTDGRHFTQAEHELEGSGIELMRMRQEGVPTAMEFLIANTPEGGRLGFDGRVVSAAAAKQLAAALKKKGAVMVMTEDLAGRIWGEERPAMPAGRLFTMLKKHTGESARDRIARVREKLQAKHADVLLLLKLEDPCWLLNIRGRDLDCTPVAYAFAMVTADEVIYYVDEKKVSAAVRRSLTSAKVTIRGYEAFGEDLAALRDKVIWADLNDLNAVYYSSLDSSVSVINAESPVLAFRAVKNKTEIESLKNAHVKDGVAMVRFLYWLKHTIGKEPLDEVSIQNKLYALRAEQDDYLMPSFPTICAYKGNAAMMHYTATEQNYAEVQPEGFLLVDSGGTYADGTTDITRTIVLGPLTADEKMYFTKVLKGMLALTRAKFLYGTTGNNLDILARGPLWDMDIDYQCGTGHGVGHVLSVHEGPQYIGWGFGRRRSAPLEPGMVTSNEPGVYLPHELGIRTENELLVVKGTKNFYGQFLGFETLTWVPIDLDAVDPDLLNTEEKNQLNQYHATVYEKISPFLDKKEKAWLKQATRKLA